jgi:hypothetical protein
MKFQNARKVVGDESLSARAAGDYYGDVVLDPWQCVPETSARIREVTVPEVDGKLDSHYANDSHNPAEREDEDYSQLASNRNPQILHHGIRNQQYRNVG